MISISVENSNSLKKGSSTVQIAGSVPNAKTECTACGISQCMIPSFNKYRTLNMSNFSSLCRTTIPVFGHIRIYCFYWHYYNSLHPALMLQANKAIDVD